MKVVIAILRFSLMLITLSPIAITAQELGSMPSHTDSTTMTLASASDDKSTSEQPRANTGLPKRTQAIPNSPETNAKSYILLDVYSGKVLAEKEPDLRLPPASLTKLMTTYVAASYLQSGQIRMTDKVTVSKKAWQMGGSRMFIQVDTDVTVADLIKGIIVSSGNDASVALAEHIAGSEEAFVGLMNHQAELLKMDNTHFTDATGMPDDDHYSSARDMALLSAALVRDFPQYYSWFKEQSYTFNNITQHNRNRLLWRYKFADGLKTGHTDAAGYCLASSATKDNMRLVSVVMGSDSDNKRIEDSISLLSYGFRFYETHQLFKPGTSITQARVWMGKAKTAGMGAAQPVLITIPRGTYSQLKLNAEMKHPLKAPLQKGQQYGDLNITLNGEPLNKIPLIALEEIPRGGFWSRASGYVKLSVHNFVKSDGTAQASSEKPAVN